MIPPFDFHEIVITPWTEFAASYAWIVLMGFLVFLACGLLGNFLILRRMALVGDAISHSILPGIVIAFLIGKSRGPFVMVLGAVAAGLLTTTLLEFIHRKTRVKQDAAIGIVFSTLFALGVLLISLFAGHVDLDADCVLYGDLAYAGVADRVIVYGIQTAPAEVLTMAAAAIAVILFIALSYKELVVTCFDPVLATSIGIRPAIYHYALMAMLSVVVVSAFRAVGAILVVGAIILPGATAYLISHRLPAMLLISAIHAALSAIVGMHLGIWFQCSFAAAMAVAGGGFFAIAWAASAAAKTINRAKAIASLPA